MRQPLNKYYEMIQGQFSLQAQVQNALIKDTSSH